MSKEWVAVLMALLVVPGLAAGEISTVEEDPSDPPSTEMGPHIDPGG